MKNESGPGDAERVWGGWGLGRGRAEGRGKGQKGRGWKEKRNTLTFLNDFEVILQRGHCVGAIS